MSVDSINFLGAIAALPDQLNPAVTVAQAVDLSGVSRPDTINRVVVLGMGGSGIAGDVVGAVGGNSVPIIIKQGYRAPEYLDSKSLVFALSYSGNTEETLSMTKGAVDSEASVIAVSCGGALGNLVTESGGVLVPCPSGLMPRAALGALVAPLLVILERLNLRADSAADIKHAYEQLSKRRDQCVPKMTGLKNPARELARMIGRTIPLIYGGGNIGGLAARRFKNDINENAKAPAFWAMYPELNHNEICGWGQHGDVTRQILSLVQLRHQDEHPRLAEQMALSRSLTEEVFVQVIEVEAQGEGRLAQLLDLMYLGAWTSCYLALDNDVDPGPIDAIAQLKSSLGSFVPER